MHFCAPGAMVPALPADAWTSAADACEEMPLRCLITWHRLHLAAALMSDLMLHSATVSGQRDNKLRRLLAVWNSRRLQRG